MKKIFSLLLIGMAFIQCSVAQDSDTKGFDKSKLFFGGTLGLAFGTYTIVNVSPLVGYHFHLYLQRVLVSIIRITDTMTGFMIISRAMLV